MAYENDPDRPVGPRFERSPEAGFGWVPMILAVAAVALLIMLLLPARNDTGPRVTENAPPIERPTAPSSPPANKPAPTNPAPTPPK